MPAMAAGAGRAAPVEQRQQLQPGGVPVRGPVGLELDQRQPAGRRRRRCGASAQVDAEPVQVLGGQVDPPVLVVLADVAQDVGELQRDAERVGQAGRLLLVVGSVPKTPSDSRPIEPATQRQ